MCQVATALARRGACAFALCKQRDGRQDEWVLRVRLVGVIYRREFPNSKSAGRNASEPTFSLVNEVGGVYWLFAFDP